MPTPPPRKRFQIHLSTAIAVMFVAGGMAYGHSHGNANLPTILAGGKALGYKHGTHVDFNLPKIGKYDVSNATEHYKLCSRPLDSDARVSNLLLTMLQRVGVKADKFQDSVKPISQIVA